jgi:hypothetical protein
VTSVPHELHSNLVTSNALWHTGHWLGGFPSCCASMTTLKHNGAIL